MKNYRCKETEKEGKLKKSREKSFNKS